MAEYVKRWKIKKHLQIKILDLLTVSNLASDEDVESITDTLENLRAVDNIYDKVKENIE